MTLAFARAACAACATDPTSRSAHMSVKWATFDEQATNGARMPGSVNLCGAHKPGARQQHHTWSLWQVDAQSLIVRSELATSCCYCR